MAIGLLGTGVSGLLSSQRALATAAQNISNVNTEGYTRQRVNLTANEPAVFGSSFVGTGVNVSSIERVYDQFLVDQVRTGTSSFNQLSQFYSLSAQVDNILGDTQAGLMTGLQDFFNAIQTVADDPTSAAARQVLISDADTLTNRFQYIDQRITDIEQAANTEIRNVVSEINSLTSAIADINKRLGELRSQGNGEPNDILDQRDLLLQQLAEKIDVTTLYQENGSVNVFVGNGQAVVSNFDSRDLAATKNQYDPFRLDISYDLGSALVDVTNQLSGGELGGLIQFRNEVTDPVKNSLGLIAIGLSETFNAQHKQGIDLKGDAGADFFTDISSISPEIFPSTNNTAVPAADINVSITDVNALTGSDYTLRRTGTTSYTLTRESDNTTVSLSTFPGASETVDGITFSTSDTIAIGDRFLIRPVRNAAADMSVAITDASKIAAASSSLPTGVSDNRNMLELAALQTGNTLKGNSVSFTSLYTQVVVDVGTKTRQAEINMNSQDSLLKMAVAARESKSGVNLDEEAADLIRFQQLYQASAQVIAVADSTFQTLLGIIRR